MSAIKISQLDHLKEVIPFKWKVQAARSWGCECVAYIDARQVMDLLDEVMGPENWQDRYYSVGNSLYCEISLRIDGEWVAKSDCGSASNFEKEKGQASDAFKRAAVKWGVGRFLYELPTHRVKAIENGKDDRGKPRYVPADEKGRKILDLTAHINALTGRKPEPQSEPNGTQKAAAKPENGAQTPPQTSNIAQLDPLAPPEAKEKIEALARKLDFTSEEFGRMIKRLGFRYKDLKLSQARQLIHDLDAMLNASASV